MELNLNSYVSSIILEMFYDRLVDMLMLWPTKCLLHGGHFANLPSTVVSNILQWQFLLYSSYNGHNSKGDHDSNEHSAESLKSIRDVQSLKNIRMRNMNRIIRGYLNINCLRIIFESLQNKSMEMWIFSWFRKQRLTIVFWMVRFWLKDIVLHTDLVEMRKREG